jgi:hypothetical protein
MVRTYIILATCCAFMVPVAIHYNLEEVCVLMIVSAMFLFTAADAYSK